MFDTRKQFGFIIVCLVCFGFAGYSFAAATSFVEPGSWSVGDVNSTYQEWDILTQNPPNSNLPDIGSNMNPAITSDPTLTAIDTDPFVPGGPFISGSANFYSFSQDYGTQTDIFNHGGSAGTGGLPAGSGTHVIIQIATSLNSGVGIIANSLEIVDHAGNALTGGDNGSALRHDTLFQGTTIGPMGPADTREEIWEFFLPNYVGDFRIQSDSIIHSSFDAIRVDSMIAPTAYSTTPIPEPMSLTMFSILGAAGLVRRKRKACN